MCGVELLNGVDVGSAVGLRYVRFVCLRDLSVLYVQTVPVGLQYQLVQNAIQLCNSAACTAVCRSC